MKLKKLDSFVSIGGAVAVVGADGVADPDFDVVDAPLLELAAPEADDDDADVLAFAPAYNVAVAGWKL